jgi:hypothetical protein
LEESDREEDDIEAEANSDDLEEDPIPIVPMLPIPAKAPRSRVVKGETIKRPRGRPPKKNPSSKVATKRAPVATKSDSGGEKFDVRGFTDLDDSESEVERRTSKPTPVRQRK